MKIIDRWNEFMGPKDERLTAEANRCAAVGYAILIIGSALCLYYGIMLNQVAETTGHPPAHAARAIGLPGRHRPAHHHSRLGAHLHLPAGAQRHLRHPYAHRPIGSHPLDYVALISLLCGLGLGVTTTVMRILAEVQIVGVENVTWGGDIAMASSISPWRSFWPSACSPPPSTAPSTAVASWSESWRSNRKRASGSALAARLSATLTAPGRTRGWCGRWAP